MQWHEKRMKGVRIYSLYYVTAEMRQNPQPTAIVTRSCASANHKLPQQMCVRNFYFGA